jgi:ABC-type uncharacterized transport system auxiliary subunit
MKHSLLSLSVLLIGIGMMGGCSPTPLKRNYLLNYLPVTRENRLRPSAYPFVLRLKEFDIEEAYARPQIVYRKSAYELQYYYYQVWAVKPTRMITDLVHKHLLRDNLVSTLIRRYDEGGKPDYELSGLIEAIEEYDSDQIWFAHLAMRFTLVRSSDGRVLYNRRFDNRKRVFENNPEHVIREMSQIMEFITNQLIHDMDVVLAREYGLQGHTVAQPGGDADTTTDIEEIWK